MELTDPRIDAAQATTDAAADRLSAFHHSIWEKVNRGESVPVQFLAEICFRLHWPGHDLDDDGGDQLLGGETHCQGGECDLALGALLRAIARPPA